MKTVLMTADTVGGVWTYALELTRALGRHEISVALATMGAPLTPFQQADALRLPNLTIHSSGYQLEWMPDPWEDVARAGDWLIGLETQVQPDIIHLNGFVHGDLPWSAPTITVAHSCVLSWWRAVKGEDAGSDWNLYAEKVRRGLQAAELVIAPTLAMLDAADSHYGPFARSRVIPNGRAASGFTAGIKEPFLFSAGRLWDEAKNLDALAEAASNLPWPVYVAGESRSPDGARGTCPASVTLLGCLPPAEVAGWLARASIYILPARYEPFGLSALEAALSGCALVLGDIPSLREVWADAAVFVHPDDPADLQAAIAALIADDARRGEMAARAFFRAREYTPARMASGYLKAYHSVLAKEQTVCA